jgi:hypothetical protein
VSPTVGLVGAVEVKMMAWGAFPTVTIWVTVGAAV